MIQIIGKGGFAREVALYLKSVGEQSVMAEYEQINNFNNTSPTLIAIGHPADREFLFEKYKCNYVSAYFSNPITSDAEVGTIICPGTYITDNVSIGKFVIINLNCTVGHDSVIGDFTTIAPGSHISGNVKIGKFCELGSGCVIREGISICDNVIIGAGAVVVKNITEPGTYAGVPAKKIK